MTARDLQHEDEPLAAALERLAERVLDGPELRWLLGIVLAVSIPIHTQGSWRSRA
jgi:hypothetical protein